MAFSPPPRIAFGTGIRDDGSPKPRRSARGLSPGSTGGAGGQQGAGRPPPTAASAGAAGGNASTAMAPRTSLAGASRGGGRSPSPQVQRLNGTSSSPGLGVSGANAGLLAELDHKSIVALSQSCTEELEAKTREKNALTKLLADLKKKKMQYDAKFAKKRREVDSTVVQTLEMEKKLQVLTGSNKMVGAEVAGLRAENERVGAEVEHLRKDLREANAAFEKEVAEVERLRQLLYTYRKEVGQEAKQRDNVQQDLRATRTAQNLMINRLDDMEKRNRALKTCVADTFNL